ncbi:hypothetical protein BOX15_Mlig001653g2 [Macrostomum lignano]|uniref:WSC domain-containing protein n=1 Tax=Macrostomum lignano TaxID=282301 RepID=A0A267G7C1_9PLAT|nr:hypothetical protein BOX15_Mlig001653g2 [Macrostomum lignano]
MLFSTLALILLAAVPGVFGVPASAVFPLVPAPSKGCYYWRSYEHLLEYKSTNNFTMMNQETCARACMDWSYKYFGLANGDRCYCGNEISGPAKLDKTYCNQQCKNAEFGQKCGGHSAMEIFDLIVKVPETRQTSAVFSAPSKGCYYWRSNEILLEYESTNNFTMMNQETCARACMKWSYKYFGLANGDRCFCGNKILLPEDMKLDKKYCNQQCKNAEWGQKCGGLIAMEIFDVIVKVPKKRA